MKKILSKLMGGVLLFSLSMSLTSCEGALDDILGEWSRPTPGSSTGGAVTSIDLDADEMKLTVGVKGQLTATVDPAGTAVTWSSDKEEIATVEANGLVTAIAEGTATITAKAGDKSATCTVTVTEVYTAKDYKEGSWDGTKVVFTKQTAASVTAVADASTDVTWSGWYTVSGEVTITGKVTLDDETHLILQDGAKLTVKQIYGNDSKYNLSIYGQANQTGQLVVNCTDNDAIFNTTKLEVHSCQVKATTSSDNTAGFIAIEEFYVYGGSVDAEYTGSSYGYGINMAFNGSMNIYGGDVKAVGKGTGSDYGYGITGPSSTVTVYGGKLWAECAGNKAIDFNNITLTKDTGYTSGKIEYSSDKTDWSETADPLAKYVRVGY